MLRHEGDQRTHHHNQRLAGYLAAIAGMVNSSGFIIIGSFTSHVTGNVGRFADDLALGRFAAFALALVMVVAYFSGAFFASMAIESNVVRARTSIYGTLCIVEAGLLAAFVLLSYVMDTRDPRYQDVQGILLCLAMGMQNSFVTRLSGAVVRTTHLTGVVTDLGIEAARWFRHWRGQLAMKTNLRLVAGDRPTIPPQAPKTILLLVIAIAFVAGSMLGAILAVKLGQFALLVPTLLLVLGGGVAIARPLVAARE